MQALLSGPAHPSAVRSSSPTTPGGPAPPPTSAGSELIIFLASRTVLTRSTELLSISLSRSRSSASAADRSALLFITVDPQRDTPAVPADHGSSSFHPRLVGLTGEPAAIKRLSRARTRRYFARSAGGSGQLLGRSHGLHLRRSVRHGRYRGFPPAAAVLPDQIAEKRSGRSWGAE